MVYFVNPIIQYSFCKANDSTVSFCLYDNFHFYYYNQIGIEFKRLMFKVKFIVRTNEKESSYAIKIVGNLQILGNWDTNQGLELEKFRQGQWKAFQQIEVVNGQQFQFKLIKIYPNNAIEWQKLPNNSNRKFKPKYHTKLVLQWSNHLGKSYNQGKSSFKIQGLPAVMMNNAQRQGALVRNPRRNQNQIMDGDDSSQQENNEQRNQFFQVKRKKSTDIREKINLTDIEEIYYQSSELEHNYQSFKKTQVNIVSSQPPLNKDFVDRIEKQLIGLQQLQNFKFKWILLIQRQNGNNGSQNELRLKRNSVKKIDKSSKEQIALENYASKSAHRNHFIFIDIDVALLTNISIQSACLYLPSSELQKTKKLLKELEKFSFVCFDSGWANKELLKFCMDVNRNQEQIQKDQVQTELTKNIDLNQQYIHIEKIIEQLQFNTQSQETSVNTVHSFTKSQALSNILQQNSILIVDSELMKTQPKFFQELIGQTYEKRFIIIVHQGGVPEWIRDYNQTKNVCIVFDNFTKLYFMGRMYDPSKKHRNALEVLQMRARLFEKELEGQWKLNDNSFVLQFNQKNLSRATYIKSQIENVLMKEYKYFKVQMKQNKVKVTWNICHPARLLRTLIRIKTIQQGQIGNFYIVSQQMNMELLKQQIKMVINTNQLLMKNGKSTKIYDFSFNTQSKSKFKIKGSIQSTDSGEISSKKCQTGLFQNKI